MASGGSSGHSTTQIGHQLPSRISTSYKLPNVRFHTAGELDAVFERGTNRDTSDGLINNQCSRSAGGRHVGVVVTLEDDSLCIGNA